MSMISLGNVHWGSAAWAPPIIVSTGKKAASLTADPVQRFVIVCGIHRLRRRERTTQLRRFGFIFGGVEATLAESVAGVLMGSSAIGRLADPYAVAASASGHEARNSI